MGIKVKNSYQKLRIRILFILFLFISLTQASFGASAYIASFSTNSFEGGKVNDLYVTVKNTGDAADLAVYAVSAPSGWYIDNGAIPAANFIRFYLGSGEQKTFGPFKVTPPETGGSGTIKWELWTVWGWGFTIQDTKLDTEYQSVTATAKPGAFNLISPASSATGVSLKPVLKWGSAARAEKYQVVMVGDWFNNPNLFLPPIKDITLGNVTEWTYDGNPPLTYNQIIWWHVIANNVSGNTENNGSWRKFTTRAPVWAGRIDSFSKSDFTGNVTSDLYVKVTNTGDTADLVVKVVSVPPDWVVNNGNFMGILGDFIQFSVGSGEQKSFGPFKVTPPETGGSGTIKWELWKSGGDKLDTEYQSVTATAKPGTFDLISPASSATGVSLKPVLKWGSAARATSYQVIMTGDCLGWPCNTFPFLPFKNINVGDVTEWTYDGNPPLGYNTVYWWSVIAKNVSGNTENSGSWRKFTTRAQVWSGTIDSFSKSDFTGNITSDIYVKATNTGDAGDLAVKVVSAPPNWVVNNGTFLGNFIQQYVGSGEQKSFGPFKVLPPPTGGSGIIQWELWRAGGEKLDTKNQSVSAEKADLEPPEIEVTFCEQDGNGKITIKARVQDPSGINDNSVFLHYDDEDDFWDNPLGGSKQILMSKNDSTGLYEATVPTMFNPLDELRARFPENHKINWYISAQDLAVPNPNIGREPENEGAYFSEVIDKNYEGYESYLKVVDIGKDLVALRMPSDPVDIGDGFLQNELEIHNNKAIWFEVLTHIIRNDNSELRIQAEQNFEGEDVFARYITGFTKFINGNGPDGTPIAGELLPAHKFSINVFNILLGQWPWGVSDPKLLYNLETQVGDKVRIDLSKNGSPIFPGLNQVGICTALDIYELIVSLANISDKMKAVFGVGFTLFIDESEFEKFYALYLQIPTSPKDIDNIRKLANQLNSGHATEAFVTLLGILISKMADEDFQNAFLKYCLDKATSSMSIEIVSVELSSALKKIIVILGKIEAAINIVCEVVDWFFTPDTDQLLLEHVNQLKAKVDFINPPPKNLTRGEHRVGLSDSEIQAKTGVPTQLEVEVTNPTSNVLFNVWVALDIWAPDPNNPGSYFKVESTLTPNIDSEINDYGTLDWEFQQLDLGSEWIRQNSTDRQSLILNPNGTVGDKVRFRLYTPYSFTNTSHQPSHAYKSGSYLIRYAVWINGPPGSNIGERALGGIQEMSLLLTDSIPPPEVEFKPEHLTPSDGQISIAWNPLNIKNVPDLVGYGVFCSTNPNNVFQESNQIAFKSPMEIPLVIDTGKINGEDYYYQIVAVDTGNNKSFSSIQTVMPNYGAILSVSPLGPLEWVVGSGTTNVEEKSVWINNSGTGEILWTSTTDSTWIILNGEGQEASGSAPSRLGVSIVPQNLVSGVSEGVVSIVANNAQGSPKAIEVRVTKTIAPVAKLSKSSIFLEAIKGQSEIVEDTVEVINNGQEVLNWSFNIPEECNWLSITPSTGQNGQIVTLKANPAGLSTGTYYCKISLESNSSNGTQYLDLYLKIKPAPPLCEINIKKDTFNIPDEGTNNFGECQVGTNIDVEFTIENTGTSDLTLSGSPIISISGENADQFSVQQQPTSPVSPGNSTIFSIRFSPSSEALKTASISIANNDLDENPYDITLTGTGVSPEINVKQDDSDIPDGGSYDFGEQEVGTHKDITFTIENIGTSDLILSGSPIISISGANADQFSIEQLPIPPVVPGGSTTFVIRFHPTSVGLKTASISIANNDEDENPYDIVLIGTGVSPEINVKQDDSDIPDGGEIDFGEQEVGTHKDITLTIENIGTSDLTLSGSPIISISGANADQFSVQQQPTSPVSPGNSTIFSIRFSPSSEALKTASISIANNDLDENPYDITLRGTGTEILFPEIDIKYDTTSIPDGGSYDFGAQEVGTHKEVTFTIENTGNSNLELTGTPLININGVNADQFSVEQQPVSPVAAGVSTTFVIRFHPTSVEIKTASLSIANNDEDENPYDIVLTGTGVSPEINVKQGDSDIPDGGEIDFGEQEVGTHKDITFTIENIGTSDLILSGSPIISISGVNADQFSVQQQPSSSIAPDNSTTFSIRFNPTSEALKTASISIANNDLDENPYDINITGTGVSPEINVKQDDSDIPDGGEIDFGEQEVGTHKDITFTIENIGTSDLTFSGSPIISISGANADQFSVQQQPSSSIASDNSTTFSIRFSPTSEALKTASISIANNDLDENPYDIVLLGKGVSPEINVKQDDSDIPDGGEIDFGEQEVGTHKDITFTIENIGTSDLTLSGSPIISISGANADQFSVQQQPSSSIAPDNSTTFSIRFNPASEALKTASISIANNDLDENPYDINITGTGVSPEINVKQDDSDIPDGGEIDFGEQEVGTHKDITFTIENIGTSDLTLSGSPIISISGANADQFSVQQQPSSSIAPDNDTTFIIRFNPDSVGEKTASLSIANNDSDENPYDINIKGKGVSPEINVKQDDSDIPDGGEIDFGEQEVGTHKDITFTIENIGTSDLTLSGFPIISISGANADQFSVQQQPTSPVSPGNTTIFSIRFNPTSEALKTASISIANNDLDENPYDIILEGTGCLAAGIDTHPQSQTINYNTSADLEVIASGTEPLSYQWYQGESGDTSTPVGTNANEYTTPNLIKPTPYWVRVSNACGSINSNTATITVMPLLIMTEVDEVSVPEGGLRDLKVKLSAQPLSDLFIAVEKISGDEDISLPPETNLLFTPDNWNIWQIVPIEAAEDDDCIDGEAMIQLRKESGKDEIGDKQITAIEQDNDFGTISLDLNPFSGTWGNTIIIPVEISDNCDEISAFGFELIYDSTAFKYEEVREGKLTLDWIIGGNEIEPGKVIIGGYSGGGAAINPLRRGSIVEITLQVKCIEYDEETEIPIRIEKYTDDIAEFLPNPCSSSFTFIPCPRLGDVSGEGDVTPGDAQKAFEIYLGILEPDLCQEATSDANCDGMTSPGDARDILNHYLGKIVLPVCCPGDMELIGATSERELTGERWIIPNEPVIYPLDTISQTGMIVNVPIIISNPEGRRSFSFDVNYAPEALEFKGLKMSHLTDHFEYVRGIEEFDGVIRVEGKSQIPIAESEIGSLVILEFILNREMSGELPIYIFNPDDSFLNVEIGEGIVLGVDSYGDEEKQLSFGKAVFMSDGTVRIPVMASTAFNMKAFGIDLRYPEEKMVFIEVERAGLTEDFIVLEGNEPEGGIVRVGGFRMSGIQKRESGVLFELVFFIREKGGLVEIIKLVDDLQDFIIKEKIIEIK